MVLKMGHTRGGRGSATVHADLGAVCFLDEGQGAEAGKNRLGLSKIPRT